MEVNKMKGVAVVRFSSLPQLLTIIFLHFSAVGSYSVAVMEFAVNLNFSQPASKVLEDNTINYIKLIEQAKNQSAVLDLIVFPEATLSPYFAAIQSAAALPPDYGSFILCNSTEGSYAQFLKNLSCAAIDYNTTVVINFTEKEVCQSDQDCSKSEDYKFYNTVVAFGTNGSILARYRKWNLFGERGKSRPTSLDLPVLHIANTTFGIMTCFDIQFGIPAFNLTKDKGVKNVIFPLQWIGELPYLTALQIQQMWAQEMNVVLLASGANLPQSGAGGSGIFVAGHGPIEHDVLPERGTKLMIQTVPNDSEEFNISYGAPNVDIIDQLALSLDSFYLLVDPSIKDHKSVLLNTSATGSSQHVVCHGEDDRNVLCCNFNTSITLNSTSIAGNAYAYHLVAFNGVRTYSGVYYGGVETCGVVACLNQSVDSCGQRFSNYSEISWPVIFNFINITGNFSQSKQRFQLPTTLLSSMRPLTTMEYNWRGVAVDEKTLTRNIELNEPQSRLLTFGIFGRDFKRDWDPISNDTGNLSRDADDSNGKSVPQSTISVVLLWVVCIALRWF
ncbi:vanin-like protein 3 [Euwallacea fornicatus]|uniref:vanin-like protein 3 n=1 Tax=Euwallacea fornicatus TaxID=995702 RepID=UPI00338F789E